MYRRVKAYECRGDDNKKLREEDKQRLIVDFKREFGRDIYTKGPNNGSIAKLAFSKPDVLARITGVPESLLWGIHTAFEAVDCKHKISPQLYRSIFLKTFFLNKKSNVEPSCSGTKFKK